MSETNKQAKSLDDGKGLLPDDGRSEQKYVLGTRAERFRLRLADDSVWLADDFVWQADDSVWQTLLGTASLLSNTVGLLLVLQTVLQDAIIRRQNSQQCRTYLEVRLSCMNIEFVRNQ